MICLSAKPTAVKATFQGEYVPHGQVIKAHIALKFKEIIVVFFSALTVVPGLLSRGRALLLICMLLWGSLVQSQETSPVVRLGVLQFGTVSWEAAAMQEAALDRRHGFKLKVIPLASMGATRIALKSGTVDMIVADWIWVAQQRARGDRLQFIPFSNAIGKVVLAANSTRRSLADLDGARIGVAGGPLSKGWLLMKAQALREGVDLEQRAEAVFAAPPLLSAALERGQLDALVTYWQFAARLEAKGFHSLIDLRQISAQLGMASELPMLGYVFRQDWADAHPQMVQGFQQASQAARRHLNDRQNWNVVRPLMRAPDAATFEQLRHGYQSGAPADLHPRQIDDAARMYQLLYPADARRAGTAAAAGLDPALFWQAAH